MNHAFKQAFALVGIVALALLTITMLMNFERPPLETVQRGYRGTAMETNYNPRELKTYLANNVVPVSLPNPGPSGPKAGAVYKNVQVLQNVSVGQFTRLMVSITQWVSPKQGCGYCHNLANMAEDSVYTKVVARRMIQMVQHVNADWQPHVAAVGVTCYTCHRGNPVPNNVWFSNAGPSQFMGGAETNVGKNIASPQIGDSSLPYDPFTPMLENAADIRVQGTEALPAGNLHSIKQTEWTYALMMHFSQSLGVNCTYCHNSRSFGDWQQSTPQRVTAWHGIQMVRDVNNTYLNSLQGVFPPARLGHEGDVAKVNCTTCHQGVFKPLYGVSMAKDFPSLQGPTLAAANAPSQAPAPNTPAPETTPTPAPAPEPAKP